MQRPAAWELEGRAQPEMALLVACARAHVDPSHTAQVQSLLSQDLDWPRLLEFAQRQKTLPLLHQGLRPYGDAVPQAAMQEIRRRFRANALRNLRLTQELVGVLRSLETAGVLAAAYRGPVLALDAYGDLSLRQFDDLDILLRRQDMGRATERLLSLGYGLRTESDVDDAVYVRSMHHHTFVGQSRTLLETHWEVTERYFGFTLDPEVWQRLKPIKLAGAQVLTLSPEDLLLAVCVHSSKHAWGRLQWICDVAELTHTCADLDWEQAWWRANRREAGRMLLLGLCLASELLGTFQPPAIQRRALADPQLPSLVAEVHNTLLAGGGGKSTEAARLVHFGFHLRLRPTAWAKARHCLRIAFIPSQEDWETLRLPARLYPLYFAARPMRLLLKYLARSRRRSSA